ncbi:MAG: hypothetical protein J0626_11675, partial [Rhodospirillaceae bacterium]|nr:hypothetical protein [Rhodospirillaceae bacterium]
CDRVYDAGQLTAHRFAWNRRTSPDVDIARESGMSLGARQRRMWRERSLLRRDRKLVVDLDSRTAET